jgi:hypothetical protein
MNNRRIRWAVRLTMHTAFPFVVSLCLPAIILVGWPL